jgi:hypothetical protein
MLHPLTLCGYCRGEKTLARIGRRCRFFADSVVAGSAEVVVALCWKMQHVFVSAITRLMRR